MLTLRSAYWACLLLFFPLSVYAQNINPTASTRSTISTSGTYSFTWNAGKIRGISPYYVWLYEDSNPIRLSYPSQGSTLKHQGEYTFRNRTKGSRTYYIKACMTNDSRDCRYSSRTTVTVRAKPTPTKVSGLHLTGGDGQVDLSWRAQTNISRYDIRYSLPRVYGGSVVVTTNRGTVKNLSDGQWEFDVRACNTDNVCGPWSDKQSKNIVKKPGVPTSFSSNESTSYDGGYTLSWGSSANTVTRYEWREKKNAGNWSGFHSTGKGRSVGRANSNGTYYYQVRACNGGGCSGVRSLTVKVDKNISPSANRSTSTSSTGGYSISWNAGRYLGKVPQYVWLYEGSNAIRLSYPSQGSSIKSSGSYQLRHTSQGTRNYYLRTCLTSNSQCVNSSTTSVKVDFPAPPKVGALAFNNNEGSYDTNGRIDVSWAALSHAKRYEVHYGIRGKNKTTLSVNSPAKSFTSLGDGLWEFQVRACNQANECGSWSNIRSQHVLRVPGVPSSFTSNESPSYDGSYTLTWGAAANSVAYYGWREQVNGGSWSSFSSTGTGRALNRIKNNGTYAYHVRACNAAGCSGTRSVTVKVDKNIAPTITPNVGNVATGGFSINWKAGRYLGQVPSYVWLYEGSKAIRLSYPSQGSTLKHQGEHFITDVSQGTKAYSIRSCLQANSQCVNSATRNITVDFPTPPKVGIVTLGNSEGSYDTNGRIDTSWASIAQAKRYEIHYGLKGSNKTTVSSNSPSRSFSGLADGLWEFQVRACNQANECGTWSNLSAKHVLRIPGVPPSFSSNASPSFDGRYTLSWSAPANTVTRYEWREKPRGANWPNFSNNNTQRSLNRTNNNGTYDYQVRACNAAGCGGVRELAVTVDKNILPTLSSQQVGQDDEFTLQWRGGRINGGEPKHITLFENTRAIPLNASQNNGQYDVDKEHAATFSYYVEACNESKSQCINSATLQVTVNCGAGKVDPSGFHGENFDIFIGRYEDDERIQDKPYYDLYIRSKDDQYLSYRILRADVQPTTITPLNSCQNPQMGVLALIEEQLVTSGDFNGDGVEELVVVNHARHDNLLATTHVQWNASGPYAAYLLGDGENASRIGSDEYFIKGVSQGYDFLELYHGKHVARIYYPDPTTGRFNTPSQLFESVNNRCQRIIDRGVSRCGTGEAGSGESQSHLEDVIRCYEEVADRYINQCHRNDNDLKVAHDLLENKLLNLVYSKFDQPVSDRKQQVMEVNEQITGLMDVNQRYQSSLQGAQEHALDVAEHTRATFMPTFADFEAELQRLSTAANGTEDPVTLDNLIAELDALIAKENLSIKQQQANLNEVHLKQLAQESIYLDEMASYAEFASEQNIEAEPTATHEGVLNHIALYLNRRSHNANAMYDQAAFMLTERREAIRAQAFMDEQDDTVTASHAGTPDVQKGFIEGNPYQEQEDAFTEQVNTVIADINEQQPSGFNGHAYQAPRFNALNRFFALVKVCNRILRPIWKRPGCEIVSAQHHHAQAIKNTHIPNAIKAILSDLASANSPHYNEALDDAIHKDLNNGQINQAALAIDSVLNKEGN